VQTLTRTRAVIFDFNGTLSDDEPVLARVFGEIFMAYLGWRMTADDYYARLAGRSDREIVETAVAERAGGLEGNGPLVERLLALRRERYLQIVEDECPIRPDTEALVGALADAGHALAIVTGAQRADVQFVLAQSNVGHHFDVVVTEEDVVRGKPDPEGFLAAAARLGVEPAQTLVLEDSVAGVRGALAAGMRCIAVTGTHDAQTLASEGIRTVDTLSPALTALL
jgi:HAD superfamily hydrolase (TIGR01509 family)